MTKDVHISGLEELVQDWNTTFITDIIVVDALVGDDKPHDDCPKDYHDIFPNSKIKYTTMWRYMNFELDDCPIDQNISI